MNDWFERSVNEAWSDFEDSLGHQIADLSIDETLLIQTSQVPSGVASCVVIALTEEPWQIGYEILATSPSQDPKEVNTDLTRLLSAGFRQSSVDQVIGFMDDPLSAARLTVRGLRSGLDQLHPSFLIVSSRDGAGNEPLDRPQHTQTPGELRIVVNQILDTYYDQVSVDDEGATIVTLRSRKIVVETIDSSPVIHIKTVVMSNVTDREAAIRELADINRTTVMMRVYLDGPNIVALLPVLAWPLIPRHLVAGCELVANAADYFPTVLDHLGFKP